MKIKNREQVKLRKMGRKYMIVFASSELLDMTDVYTLNESAAYLMRKAAAVESFDVPMLAAWLIEEYGIDAHTAEIDATANAECWRELGLLQD